MTFYQSSCRPERPTSLYRPLEWSSLKICEKAFYIGGQGQTVKAPQVSLLCPKQTGLSLTASSNAKCYSGVCVSLQHFSPVRFEFHSRQMGPRATEYKLNTKELDIIRTQIWSWTISSLWNVNTLMSETGDPGDQRSFASCDNISWYLAASLSVSLVQTLRGVFMFLHWSSSFLKPCGDLGGRNEGRWDWLICSQSACFYFSASASVLVSCWVHISLFLWPHPKTVSIGTVVICHINEFSDTGGNQYLAQSNFSKLVSSAPLSTSFCLCWSGYNPCVWHYMAMQSHLDLEENVPGSVK